MDTRCTPEKDTSEDLRVLIRPNRSLTFRGMAVLLAGMTAFTVTVGTGFALAGAWLVFPFAGLELAVVGAVLYRLLRHADDHDLIVIGNDRVAVIRRRGGHERHDDFQRYWTKVTLEHDRGWYPSRLKIGSHGRFVLIGADIGEEERQVLAARLNDAVRSLKAKN